jgi:uncharacterized protein YjgD (DUF1641 family)
MAHPITFKPKPVDPHVERMQRVEGAPKEHAEALLVLWDLLQVSHDKGLLDLAVGLVEGKDIITGKLAEAANLPESVAAIRNGMALARVLGSLDPDMLQRLAKSLDDASKQKVASEQQAAQHGSKFKDKSKPESAKPPGIFAITKRALSADGRRGLAFATDLLVSLGRATKE